MKSARLLCALVLVGGMIATVSCGDPSTTVPTGPTSDLNRNGGWVTIIRQTIALVDSCASLPAASVTKTIGKQGGMIVVGPDTLIIPANALNKPVDITASLPDGYFVNVVKFQPDGLQFKKSATLIMGYSNCNVLGTSSVRIAQVDDDRQVIDDVASFDYTPGKSVYGSLAHFSNYAIAW